MPESTNPRPESTNPRPEPTNPRPESTNPRPEPTNPRPEPTNPRPGYTIPYLTEEDKNAAIHEILIIVVGATIMTFFFVAQLHLFATTYFLIDVVIICSVYALCKQHDRISYPEKITDRDYLVRMAVDAAFFIVALIVTRPIIGTKYLDPTPIGPYGILVSFFASGCMLSLIRTTQSALIIINRSF